MEKKFTPRYVRLILFVSILLNLFFITRYIYYMIESPRPTGCAESIPDDQARFYVDGYHNFMNHPDIKGGYICKEVFNEIFENPEVTGVSYYLCNDTTGRVLPAKELFIIVTGAHSSEGAHAEGVSSCGIYLSRMFCPPDCGRIR